MGKIKIVVSTGYENAKHEDEYEIDSEEWAKMTEEEKQEELDQACLTIINNHICANAWYED